MREIELKLAAAPADLPLLKRELLKLAGRESAPRSTLTSIYFDTLDRQLQRQGLNLRVRRRSHRFVQTVKTEIASDLLPMARAEWEDIVTGALPDLHAPNGGPHLPETLTESELRPVFTTVIRRSAIPLHVDENTEIEAAIDTGLIQAAEQQRDEAICELELESKVGDPAAIYAIGLRLVEVAALRIEMRSKAERGFALVDGIPTEPQAVHASAIVLKPEMTVEAVLQHCGSACLALVLRNEPAALAGDAEGLHQMRVAIRRLRAVLSGVKRMLPTEQYRWVTEELKWLAHALGPARNWDVIVDGIVAPVGGASFGQQERDVLTRACGGERSRAHREAETAIRSVRYTKALLQLLRWFTARAWREQLVSEHSALLLAPIGEVAPRLISRRYKQVCKASRNFAELDSEQRHRLRIAVKKLRYAIDLLQALFANDAVARFLKNLKPLQDELGHANDLRVARDLFAGLQISEIDRAAGVVLGWHERGLVDREAKLNKQLHRLRHVRPFW
jgi:inorganic triphosphatase YgiF